jgi:hypothetical protein
MDNFNLIKHFGNVLGINLEFNPDGIYLFEIDELTFAIYDLNEYQKIILHGNIGHPPPDNNEKLFKTLLEAQYMLKGTSGATFSINPDTGELALCKVIIPATLNNDSFFQETENFVNVLHSWANIIRNYRSETSLTDESTNIFLNSNFLSI